MHKDNRTNSRFVSAVLLSVVSTTLAQNPTPPELDVLFKPLQAASDELRRYEFDYSVELSTFPDGQGTPLVNHMKGRVAVDQRNRFAELEYDELVQDPDGKERTERIHARTVINQEYAASWRGGKYSPVEIVEHPSAASISPETQEQLNLMGAKAFERSMFGSATLSLPQSYARSKGKEWTVLEGRDSAGARIFTVRMSIPNTGKASIPAYEWDLAPEKSFGVVAYRAYVTYGVLGFERLTTLQPIDGGYFPTTVEERTYRSWNTDAKSGVKPKDTRELRELRKIQIANFANRDQFEADRFTVAAFKAPNGTSVHRVRLKGAAESQVLSAGVALPDDVYLDLQAAQKAATQPSPAPTSGPTETAPKPSAEARPPVDPSSASSSSPEGASGNGFRLAAIALFVVGAIAILVSVFRRQKSKG